MSKIKRFLIPENKKKRTRRFILYSFLILIIAVRIWLPFFLKDKLVAAVNEVEGYECTLDDLDLHLFRGAMIFNEFEITITENDVTKPFVYCKNADISVEWRAIFHGSIVSEVILDQLELYFADGESKEEEQTGDASWVEPIIDFIPLKINHFAINNGQIEFENMVSEPPVNLKLTDLNLIVENLTNSTDVEKALPSSLKLTSHFLDQGKLTLEGELNILKEIPDMDLNLDLQAVNVKELNDFTEAYANFDFEKGEFALAAEFAALNGEAKGYVKPILNDVKVLNVKEDTPVLNGFWQAFVGLAFNITKNIKKDRTGTKIPIEGKIDNPDIGIGTTIINIFKNAFIKAYEAEVDNSVSLKDIAKEQDERTFWEKFKGLFSSDDEQKN
ncbi:hypothetical protein CW751_08760 [Brumimicrobium salinarum]|uniref:DUF748 domain-containing protein n=1 Tax=Brumimicrobium salinarum TaxID=2058658 RepID=A0A2I0R2M9_9FLAO|nr:DUF748 domain-containing protein [Brumimicrobium salinarum]PKR80843.1 hypothetical protein CW751_08760 [Brumimicrobium salinarum]